ncbi:MAG: Flp pilus assembly complex ATPase component TadA, partial [Clostridia bacterium]|nr:Flp pilus assembly complex ATPase component TadA [Clostridia bacterium]
MDKNSGINETVSISGLVDYITYRNSGNFYTVAEVRSGKEKITVVGTLPFLNEGESAEFTGKYIVHPTYGQQFKAESYIRKAPATSSAILRYLSTGAIRGIGPSTANKIVEKFGDNSLEIIQNHPDMLATIKGISLQKANEICDEYAKQFGVRDIMFMLSKYSISPEKCLSIYKVLGQNAKEMIERNPYVLCEEKIGISFEDVELIASDYDFEAENELRIAAGIEYVLKRNLLNGHTCLPRDKVVEASGRLLGCENKLIDETCDRLIECFKIAQKEIEGRAFISIAKYHSAEEYIAARLFAVKRFSRQSKTIDPLEIDIVEKSLGITFEDLQRKAISEAFESGILILTGGPGTGKTTTLNAIIQLFENRNMNIQLAAPTGRAAQRITELTGREAKTIHRLLEAEWNDGDNSVFSRNERNPLECDVLVVDEASMIDVLLFESLLKALRISCRIIIVGDADQLPSIGAGNVLNDILSSEAFPSIELKKVFRQSAKSNIVTNAHRLINGEKADFSNAEGDCFFLKRNDK